MSKVNGADIIEFIENGWPGGRDGGYHIEKEKLVILDPALDYPLDYHLDYPRPLFDKDGDHVLDYDLDYDLDLFGRIVAPDGSAMPFAYYFYGFLKERKNKLVTLVIEVPEGDEGLVRQEFRQFLFQLKQEGPDWTLVGS